MVKLPVIALTPGEPTGVGPDLCVQLAQAPPPAAALVLIADPEMLRARARSLGYAFAPAAWTGREAAVAGGLYAIAVRTAHPVSPGRLDPANARYVVETLEAAVAGCLRGEFDALVTGPVHKGVLNDAGIPFSGHTEFLAERAGCPQQVVMMLACPDLRVALATTHLPLAEVSRHITRDGLERTIRVLHRELRARFGIAEPEILVLGLNPHAGESGYLGREEIEIIAPLVATLRAQGLRLKGPLPADTAFLPATLAGADAVLAMYHDQGLPVIKHHDFARTVNVTLGLPFVRTSVDHGTALELAGSGRADASSLRAALDMAIRLCRNRG